MLRIEDMAYLKPDKRFAIVANRFDWGMRSIHPSRRRTNSFAAGPVSGSSMSRARRCRSSTFRRRTRAVAVNADLFGRRRPQARLRSPLPAEAPCGSR